MGLLRRYRWFAAAAGFTLVFALLCARAHEGPGLTLFGDIWGLASMLAGSLVCALNVKTRPREERSFWILLALGFLLWTINQAAWTVWENVLHRPIPDPFFYDIVLFFHVVPLIAAVAWRPDFFKRDGKVLLGLLNFLMLFGWWVFLYAFIVFPHQYVVHNVHKYNSYYDGLYGIENAVLVAVLILAVLTSSGGWRRLYMHLLGASLLYAINSQLLDRAEANNTYFSGSPYDIPLIGTVAWMCATCFSAREWNLAAVKFNMHSRWKELVGQLAMLAILSLPILGLWAVLEDKSPASARAFRVFTVLGAMLVLGTFVFLRQYLQDQALMALLKESRRAYESQKELQRQLVQKEKLASLGNLVAGAARDINHPLNAIMSHSDELWAKERLTEDQDALLRKIVNQARRTRDLISNLLSFAQQAPGEKTPVDLSVLLSRAMQMLEARRHGGKVQIKLSVQPDFPRVLANANQLFQAFVEIIENAIDVLEDSDGGLLHISAQRLGADVTLQFSDTGPGLIDPERVFDPFYTTKPVGKGTGLGLSAVYGIIQDHAGQISCRNNPEGGAMFTIKLPMTAVAARVAGAAGD